MEDKNYYEIYQIKKGSKYLNYRFESLTRIQNNCESVDAKNYDLIYKGNNEDKIDLEELFAKFNINKPSDFTGHSMSVSDVVLIKNINNEKAYFCDDEGFKEIFEFDKSLVTNNEKLIKTAKKYINEFSIVEFGSDASFDDLSNINVAYTVSEDCNHEIQVCIDLNNLTVNKFVDRLLVDSEEYDTLEQFIECQISCLDFDELIRINDEEMIIGESL